MAKQDKCRVCGGGPPYGPYPKGSSQVAGHTRDQCFEHLLASIAELEFELEREKAKLEAVQRSRAGNCIEGYKKLQAIVDSINSLRGDAGACVLIYCDNDDISSDIGCAVAVTAHWTEWQLHRFTGENLTDALTNACEAAEAARKGTEE